MLRGTSRSIVLALIALVALALAVAACGGDSSTSSAETEATTEATTEAESSDEASLAAAEEVIAPFVGQPSPFPVTEDLKEVPKGATIAFTDCGTPICAIFGELFESAAKKMGVSIERVKTGTSANTVGPAMDSIVAKEPDAVIVVALNIELWKKQLEELQENEVAIVTSGITDVEQYGIEAPTSSNKASELEGELLANYVFAKMNPEANAVIYNVPELPFANIITEKFPEELEAICSGCTVRTADVGVEEIGNTAPNTIVSDLQAHPDTNVAVFATGELETGLPPALKAAGIEVETIGNATGPTNLQYLKEGKESAGLATDLAILGWTLVDQAARKVIGQKLTGLEAEGATVRQFLTKEDITFNPELGWSGYPDFEARFEKLWGVGA